jgi:glutamate synthase domain-containing protein 1
MKNLTSMSNTYRDSKVIDSCSIFGMMDVTGKRFSGADIIKAIANMHDRGNGLGGGFAVYGLYPEMADHYAFHIMFLSEQGKQEAESLLQDRFQVSCSEVVPVRPTRGVSNAPEVWRYFLKAGSHCPPGMSEDDYVVRQVMAINTFCSDSFVFSSGKDMAVFKGVGYPEDIGNYFRLDEYEGYLWTSHGRFPTNTRGWWGGAHPFNLLDWTVVHNGEISSYGINRRYLEQFGYKCTMETDTEVIAYAVDLLARRHGLPSGLLAKVLAPPFWDAIERMPDETKTLYRTLRQVYGSLALNGPFTIIVAHHGEMIGLADRVRLRPLIVGEKGDTLYLTSEEAAIRLICSDLDRVWIPTGGQPVIGKLGIHLQGKGIPVGAQS